MLNKSTKVIPSSLQFRLSLRNSLLCNRRLFRHLTLCRSRLFGSRSLSRRRLPCSVRSVNVAIVHELLLISQGLELYLRPLYFSRQTAHSVSVKLFVVSALRYLPVSFLLCLYQTIKLQFGLFNSLDQRILLVLENLS